MSRYFLLAMVLFSFRLAAAQNSNDLMAKYGPPDVEGYEVASGVTLTVRYGQDRQACQLKIEARQDSILGKDPRRPPPEFSSELADRLLVELVPIAERKGQPKEMLQQMGCAGHRSAEYENVRISQATNECQPKEANVSTVTVEWKRLACATH